MLTRLKEFIRQHKTIFYIYIAWCILHIILFLSGGMISGRTDYGFFPFNGFDVDDYGLVEFFVYIIALPVLAYLFYDLASPHDEFKKVTKWMGIVLASLVGLFFVFYIVSLFFGRDYDKTGVFLGRWLGFMMVYSIAYGIQIGLTKWLSYKLVYSHYGSATKYLYIFLILPLITATTTLLVLFSYIKAAIFEPEDIYHLPLNGFWFWCGIIMLSVWIISFMIGGVYDVLSKNKLAEVANGFLNEADIAVEKGEIEKAKNFCRKSLRICEHIPETEYPNKANSYVTLGQIHLKEGDNKAAVQDYERGLAIRRRQLGDNHKVIAAYYSLIAEAYAIEDEFEEEIIFRRKNLETLISVYGGAHEETAEAYVDLSFALFHVGEYTEAIDCMEHALSIRQTTLGPNNTELISLYSFISALYCCEKDYDKAREYAIKELLIKEVNYGFEHPDLANSYDSIGETYLYQEDFQNAMDYYQKSLDLRKKILGEDSIDTASSYNGIGNVYLSKGDYTNALDSFLTALHIQTKNNSENTIDLVYSNTKVGTLYYLLGDYNKAQHFSEAGIKIGQALLGDDDVELADCYDTLGCVIFAKGEYAKAMEYFEIAYNLRDKYLGENNVDKALSLMNFGVVHHQCNEYTKAVECYERALAIMELEKDDIPLHFSMCLNNIGIMYPRIESMS